MSDYSQLLLLKTTEEEDKEEEETAAASRAAANEISTDAAVLSELDCILALKEEQTALKAFSEEKMCLALARI